MLLKKFRVAYESGDVSRFSNEELKYYIRYLRLLERILEKDFLCVGCDGTMLDNQNCRQSCVGDKCRMMRELFCLADKEYDEFVKIVKKESIQV